MDYFTDKQCEICQASATAAVCDAEEIEPFRAEWDGKFYRRYKAAKGGMYFFCQQHKRPQQCKSFFTSDEDEIRWLAEQRKKAGVICGCYQRNAGQSWGAAHDPTCR